ncbi:MAG: hypothetical protein WA922_11285 [Pontixanthobacter sp.]
MPAAVSDDYAYADTPVRLEAVNIVAGSHLAGAESTIPIVKALWNMAAGLANRLPHCKMVLWQHSDIAHTPLQFGELAAAWDKKMLLPVGMLVRVLDDIDRGIKTRGLTFFTGQELRIEPELTDDRDWAGRLAMRLAEALIIRGSLSEAEEFTGPDGSKLRLAPSKNRKFVRVWRS